MSSRTLQLIREFGNDCDYSLLFPIVDADDNSSAASTSIDKEIIKEALTGAMINMKLTLSDGLPVLVPIPIMSSSSRYPRVYLGSIGCAYNQRQILQQQFGITHIICATSKARLKYSKDFVYKRIDVEDCDADIYCHFEECIQFIRSCFAASTVFENHADTIYNSEDNNTNAAVGEQSTHLFSNSDNIDGTLASVVAGTRSEGSVLIHCYQGKSRSVAICMAYLIADHGYDVSSALELIRSVRPCAQPNSHFMTQLQRFYQEKICSK